MTLHRYFYWFRVLMLAALVVWWMLTPRTPHLDEPHPAIKHGGYEQCLQTWPEYWSRTCGYGRKA